MNKTIRKKKNNVVYTTGFRLLCLTAKTPNEMLQEHQTLYRKNYK